MGAIHLVRHGQASFGKANYDKLSPLGITQSEHAGKHFARAGIRFHRVAAGEMVRHQETMQHCLQAMQHYHAKAEPAEISIHANSGIDAIDAAPLINGTFNEFDHEEVVARFRPDFADKSVMASYLAQQPRPAAAFQSIFDQAMRRWLSGEYDEDYKESWEHFRTRCLTGFHALLEHCAAGENIAVFTSGGPISVITQHLLGVPDEQVLNLNYAMINASITKIFYNGERVSLSSFNSYSHLESANTPNLVTYR